MGAVLAAVSPAVVVPRMVSMMESGIGTNKSIPHMIMAGASCDDIFVIVLFKRNRTAIRCIPHIKLDLRVFRLYIAVVYPYFFY